MSRTPSTEAMLSALRDAWLARPEVKAAMRWRWLRTYAICAYCGKLLSWKWKWCRDFDKHRLIDGACQCERIGGHPRVEGKQWQRSP
jgi:hypothetical protein